MHPTSLCYSKLYFAILLHISSSEKLGALYQFIYELSRTVCVCSTYLTIYHLNVLYLLPFLLYIS